MAASSSSISLLFSNTPRISFPTQDSPFLPLHNATFLKSSPKTGSLSLRLEGVSSINKKKLSCKAVSSTEMAAAEGKKKKVDVFDSKDELAVNLAKYTADLSDKFTKERGAFTVVLSGGSLIDYLRKLLEPPYLDSVDWSKWRVFWVDERVVPKDHEDSNYKLAYDGFLSKIHGGTTKCIWIHEVERSCSWNSILTGLSQTGLSEDALKLFSHMRNLAIEIGHYTFPAVLGSCSDLATLHLRQQVPIPPGNVYAINDALSAEGAADDYETCLRQLVKSGVIDFSEASGFPKFDLMLLGMGPDGHVASLFPGHPLVNEKEKWVTFIKNSPKPPPERITFTFPVINSSAYIALVVTGAGKADAVHKALGTPSDDSNTLPVELVSPAGELTWFLDKNAASKL